MAMPGLLISAVKAALKSRSNKESTPTTKRASRRPGASTTVATLSFLAVAIALGLSMIALFAGDMKTKADLEQYNIFTLNVSRIAENIRNDIDQDVKSVAKDLHFRRSFQLSVDAMSPIVTSAPSTLLRVRSPIDIGSKLSSLTKKAGSDLKHAGHGVKSDAKSLESHAASAAKSAASSAIGKVESEIIKAVNSAYAGIIKKSNLTEDWFSLHMLTTCQGGYITSDGKNITVGGNVLPDNGTTKHVALCESHSALDPIQVIRVIYIIGMVFLGCTLLVSLVGIWSGHRLLALGEIVLSVTAFVIIGFVTAITHGVAYGAAKLINFIGEEIGVEASIGKWVNISWAVVGLLAFNCLLCLVLGRLRHREEKKQELAISRPIEMNETTHAQPPQAYHRFDTDNRV